MTQELALKTQDLKDAGITSQLTSNDLLEVIANDLYEKFMAEINSCVESSKILKEKYLELMQPEFDSMRDDLVKAKMLGKDERVNTGYSKLNGDDWASYIQCYDLDIYEKEKGTKIQKDDRHFSVSYPKGKEAKMKLKITCDEIDEDTNSKLKEITCKINTSVRKEFEKVITVSTERFKLLNKEIAEHNKRIDNVIELIPSNGLLSVERFTREARIKMNKKILSSQPADFKKKISALFKIQL